MDTKQERLYKPCENKNGYDSNKRLGGIGLTGINEMYWGMMKNQYIQV